MRVSYLMSRVSRSRISFGLLLLGTADRALPRQPHQRQPAQLPRRAARANLRDLRRAGRGHAVAAACARAGARAAIRRALAALAVVLAWQSGAWYSRLLNDYPTPARNTWFFADQELEAIRLVAARPGYDEVWLDTSSVGRPYIFLLLAQALPPAEVAGADRDRAPATRDQPRAAHGPATASPTSRRRACPGTCPPPRRHPQRPGPGYLLQEWRRGQHPAGAQHDPPS